MTESLPIFSFFTDSFSNIVSYFNSIIENFDTFLYTSDNIHILSITFILLILVSIFFLLIFLTTKIISFFLKTPTGNANDKNNSKIEKVEEDSEEEFDVESDISYSNDSEKVSSVAEENTKDYLFEENTNEIAYQNIHPKEKQKSLIELDWKKTKKPFNNQEKTPKKEYTPLQLKKNIRDLIAMIVNMLGRNIDELKISQALMYRSKDALSEESVLQLVNSIKEFLTLCNTNIFEIIRKNKDLPSDEECILHLLAGDTSYAMALLEALMDTKINQAIKAKNSVHRNSLFQEASYYACCFGTLAEINNPSLAVSSFELAVETCPENILAWSRCADLYKQAGLDEKANWAYKQVLSLAKKNDNISQKANANKYLSQYLYSQGESSHAAELYLESKNYYDSIGINRPLDKKELEIIALLDNTANDSIVHTVLHNKNHVHNL